MTNSQNDDRISILICTANLGNAQPDEESWNQLVPNDGVCSEVASSPYPLRRSISSESVETSTTFLKQEGRQFDLIVFGLQEATFDPMVPQQVLDEVTVVISESQGTIESSLPEASPNNAGFRAKLRETTKFMGKSFVKHTKDTLESLTASRDHLSNQNHIQKSNGMQALRSLMDQRLPSYDHIV